MWKILIVDSSTIVRIGLNQVVSGNFDCEVLSEETTSGRVVKHLRNGIKFDLIIIGNIAEDVEEFINEIRRFSSETRILIFAKNLHYPHAMSFLIAGANGFLPRSPQVMKSFRP